MNKSEMQYQILNNFKGIGNVHGQYWFIGIEEAYDFTENLDSIVKEYSKAEYLTVAPSRIIDDSKSSKGHYTKIYDIMSKIIVGPDADWRKYRNCSLLQVNSNEFQMNLYPLGKPNVAAWKKQKYEEIFGFQSMDDYMKIVRENRFPNLRRFRKEYYPKATICFGSKYADDFMDVFEIGHNDKCVSLDGGRIQFFPESKIFLTPFFRYNLLPHSRIKTLRNAIHEMCGE